jgi:16S rRNA (adenine1518-N6/adenine1519-N6)-dimethyltransferase
MRARKKYGQHFLEPVWAAKLVDAIAPQPHDRFLEIGPGPGVLTLRLAPRVAHLTAVEIDPQMVAALRPRLPPNVTVVETDILEFDLATLARPLRVAGNLPYNVSSPILFRLIAAHRARGGLVDATLMLQREVADRIQAAPGTGDYGVLAILTQLHADVRRLLTLPPGAFRPRPTVHSAVIQLRFREPAVALADERGFEAMVRSMFTQRRKTLANALRPFAAATRRPSWPAPASIRGGDPRRCNSQSWRSLRTRSVRAEVELCYSQPRKTQKTRIPRKRNTVSVCRPSGQTDGHDRARQPAARRQVPPARADHPASVSCDERQPGGC